ncbi:hypothetical protein [Lactobacillus kitasatonis]|uniref:hypothetical protein n=1 Tax=Lactobacillus kitasatonis TaxID=237446 RepID=UPI003F65655B
MARETDADILEITLRNPYPANYRKTLNRANCERIQNDSPELEMQLPDLSQYDTIYYLGNDFKSTNEGIPT